VKDGPAALLGNERGVAVPLALITLLVLASLLLELSAMSTTEPSIAANQLRSAQAAALADAGLERAIWALAHPGSAQGLADPLPALIPPPYDGSLLVPVTAEGMARGGFRLTVATGGASNERDIVAVGWTPTDDPGDARAKAHHRLVATLVRIRAPADSAPCALCAVGDLQVAAGAAADARGDTTCGAKLGAWTSGAAVMGPGAEIWGADGNAVSNQAGDIAQGQPAEGAGAWAFTNGELAALRRLAQSRGTYYRGSVTFDGTNLPRDGLVFVDTVSGAPISDATPETDLARVVVSGGAGVFRGWMIVSGTLEISGDARLRGLAYALDGFAYRGAGPGGVEGQVVAHGLRGGVTVIQRTGGGPAIHFDCAAARSADGLISFGWMLKPGSYRELPD
jgi:hypothetical protein